MESNNNQNLITNYSSISKINKKWTDKQRRIVWTLICKAHGPMQVDLNPIVTTAFVILQFYFKNSQDCEFDLFTLMEAAIFISCKQSNCYRSINTICSVLLQICRSVNSKIIRAIPGNRINPDYNEVVKVTNAEMKLLK